MPDRKEMATTANNIRPSSADELTRRNVELVAQLQKTADEQRSFGQRFADRAAAVIGSWPFIIIQTVFLAFWMAINVLAIVEQWDPYPFILLNLVLSFQAAYAGPILMMSQNRQARLDERRNHLDLQINLLAEQEATEILHLLRKLCLKAGVTIENEASLRALAEATQPANVLEQIEKAMGSDDNKSNTAAR